MLLKISLCLFVLLAAPAAAQVMTVPLPAGRGTVTCEGAGCEAPAAILSRHLSRGDVRRLQAYAQELLLDLAKNGPPDLRAALGDATRHYYRLIWLGRDDAGGTSVQSFVAHAGETGAVRTLPGIEWSESMRKPQLLDVLVTSEPGAVLDSQYISTPLKDPLAAQIASFVERTGVIGFLAGLPVMRGSATVSTTYIVSRPVLPLARAEIKIKDTIIVPGTAAGLRNAAAQLRDRLSVREARLSPCGQKLAEADAAAITAGLASQACTVPRDQTVPMTQQQVNTCRTRLTELLAEAYEDAATCRDPIPAPGGDPLLVVDKQFNDLVAVLRETRRTAETKLTNTPRTRYTLGVLSSAMLGSPNYSGSTIRAKVGANGSLIQDPMPTVLTMMIVNIHPRPYDAQQDAADWRERFRLFAGTSVTPDFGIGGGAGVMIVRGLSVNAGVANLFVKTPRAGLAVGQTPPAGQSPLSVGNARVWFAGLSYSFK